MSKRTSYSSISKNNKKKTQPIRILKLTDDMDSSDEESHDQSKKRTTGVSLTLKSAVAPYSSTNFGMNNDVSIYHGIDNYRDKKNIIHNTNLSLHRQQNDLGDEMSLNSETSSHFMLMSSADNSLASVVQHDE